MIQMMIIPCLKEIENSLDIAKKYNCVFEYNDFTLGNVLDNEKSLNNLYEQIKHLPYLSSSNVHGVFYDITIFSGDNKIRKISEHRVRQSMDVAVKLGCKGVVFHTNYMPTFRLDSYEKGWINDNKEFFAKILKEYPDTTVYMENMFDLEPELLLDLAQEMKEHKNFSICLDIAHAHLSNIPATIWIKKFEKYIGHIHINDNDKKSDGHLPFGMGTMDYKSIFNAILEYCPDATMLIEVASTNAQKQCFEYLAKNFPDIL